MASEEEKEIVIVPEIGGTINAKMAEYGLSELNYCDFMEDHLSDIVKFIVPDVFLTQLRSSRFLSESDCEEIRSPYLHPTRRERATKFCDVLMTKGFDAFKLFLELLEYEYPHVFTNITNCQARNPPQGYERHTEGRISQSLDDFVRMGFKVANLRNHGNNLFNQLEELQKMLEFTQKEKTDLEREIQSLRPYAMKSHQLQEKLNEAEKEIRNLKDENREFMKKNIQYRDEMDREQSRIEQLLIDRDDLDNKLKEATNDLERMNQSQDFLREKFEEERKKSQRLINIATRRTAKVPPVEGKSDSMVERQQARNMQNISTKMEILQCDLDAEREKVKDLCATLDVTQADLTSERQTVEILRREKLKLQRECDQTHLFLKHGERKNEQYFKTIQELEKEKRKAEEEKILVQQKCWDISDQKQQLFVAKRNLEQRYDRLQQGYQRLRESHRNSLTEPKEAFDGGDDSHDVTSPTIRPRLAPLQSPRSPGPMLHSEDLDQFSEDNVVDQSRYGDNLRARAFESSDNIHSGEYEKTLACESTSMTETLVPSEEFECDASKDTEIRGKSDSLKVSIGSRKGRRRQIDDDDPRCWSEDEDIENDNEDYDNAIRFRYEREESSSSSSDVHRDSDVFSLRTEVVPENSPYISWFDGQNGAGLESSGDQKYGMEDTDKDGDDSVEKLNMKNLFVRSNVTWEDKTNEHSVPIKEGEFVFIADTTKPSFFQVNKVEPTTGHRMMRNACGLIPDYELAKQQSRRPSGSIFSLDTPGCGRVTTSLFRRDAIRNRDCSPYTVIAPLKALQKLPVLLNGNPTLVEAILNVLATDAEDWAMIVRKPVLINYRQNWREMCDLLRHTVMPGNGINHQSDRDQHRYIVINIKLIADDCQEQLKTIFGHDFEDLQCDRGVALSKWALHSETLIFPSAKITDRTSLMSQLREKIAKVQESIFWMTISLKTINSLKIAC